MSWNEYVQNDPRRLAQKALTEAHTELRRVAKDDEATDEAFDIANKRFKAARAHLESIERNAVKDMFK